MNKIDWTYLSAILSVAFGWFLNELGQWFRTRKEDKKIKRQVLYNLLEVNFTFTQLDISELVEVIAEKALTQIPKSEQTEDVKKFLEHFYSNTIGKLIYETIMSKLEVLAKKYMIVVDNLATIDPITAYRLNGKTNITDIFGIIHEYQEIIKKNFPEETEKIQYHISTIIEKIKPEILKEAIEDLEFEIKHIAYSINFWTGIKIKKTLKSTRIRIKDESKKKIDELLEELSQYGKLQDNNASIVY